MAAAAAALIRSSAGRALRSASAIVCKPATGSHVVRVDGYSHLRGIPKDQSVNSSAFDVGGHRWRLRLYPNGGSISKHEGHIGVFLSLDSDPAAGGCVWATQKFSVLDHVGNSCSRADTGLCSSFTHRGSTWGFMDFISKEELEKPEYLVDDSFAIQCDVTVTTVRECSDHMAFISPNTKSEAP